MENHSDCIADFSSGIADCSNCEYLDDFGVALYGYDGVIK